MWYEWHGNNETCERRVTTGTSVSPRLLFAKKLLENDLLGVGDTEIPSMTYR